MTVLGFSVQLTTQSSCYHYRGNTTNDLNKTCMTLWIH